MLMGTYERAGVPWSPETTPWDFGQDLLPPTISSASRRASRSASSIFRRSATPASARWSTARSPSRPTATRWSGPFAACAISGSPAASWPDSARAAAWAWRSSHWMVDGDPGADVWGMDVARYGDWTTLAYTNAKVRENYSRRFRIRFPNEELPRRGRCARRRSTRGCRPSNAVFGDYCGLEHPLWFAPSAHEAVEEVSFRRSNAHPHVPRNAARCATRRRPARDLQLRQVRDSRSGRRGVALRVHGEPRAGGRPHRADADAQRARQAHRRFHGLPRRRGTLLPVRHLCGRDLLPALVRAAHAAGRRLRASLRDGISGLSVAGPNSRALLQGLVRDDLSSAAFPFMSFRRMEIGMVPALRGSGVIHRRTGLSKSG